jgi:hypothetical protein
MLGSLGLFIQTAYRSLVLASFFTNALVHSYAYAPAETRKEYIETHTPNHLSHVSLSEHTRACTSKLYEGVSRGNLQSLHRSAKLIGRTELPTNVPIDV